MGHAGRQNKVHKCRVQKSHHPFLSVLEKVYILELFFQVHMSAVLFQTCVSFFQAHQLIQL